MIKLRNHSWLQMPLMLGSVVERKPTSSLSRPSTATSNKTGFPSVQHRSKSAFARNRGEEQNNSERVTRSLNEASTLPAGDDWRDRMSKENEERVASMDNDEREDEKRQILDRFGANIGDVLKRARLVREHRKQSEKQPEPLNVSQGF